MFVYELEMNWCYRDSAHAHFPKIVYANVRT